MLDVIGGLAPPVVLAILGAILLLLGWLARVNAALGLAIGLAFLALPVALWTMFDRRYFQSEGSAAGLVFFLFYALAGVVAGTLGAGFAGSAVARLARGEKATAFGRRAAFATLGSVALVLTAAAVYRIHGAMETSGRLSVKTQQHERVVRVVSVGDGYALAWKSRGEAPALALAVPAADFARAPGEAVPAMHETRDGPRMVELALGSAEVPYATLRLHRDAQFVDDAVLDALERRPRGADPSVPGAFWVDTRGGAGTLLGFQCAPEARASFPALRCHEPEAPLARIWPGAYGLERVRLHAAQDRHNARCDMSFHFRDRVAIVSSRSACFDAGSVSALASGAELLARMARDARDPPVAAERLARADAAVARCEKAQGAAARPAEPGRRRDPEDYARQACGYALRAAAAELRASTAEAVPLLLRALETRRAAGGVNEGPYAALVIEALAASGRAETRDALRAHSLRVAYLHGSSDALAMAEKRASREAVAALAPRVLVKPDDPAFALADSALDAEGDEAQARRLALLQSRYEQAHAAAPGSDLAFATRYDACRARTRLKAERAALGACADDLLAGWQARAAASKPIELAGGEPELAQATSAMYYMHAYASEDFAAGLAAMQRAHRFAAERLAAVVGAAPLLAEFERREAEVAAKLPRAARGK